jgi:hypothetical protein
MNFSKQSGSENVQNLKIIAFLRSLDDLHFKCTFHKQSGFGSGSEIKVKVGSGSEREKKIISDTQHC